MRFLLSFLFVFILGCQSGSVKQSEHWTPESQAWRAPSMSLREVHDALFEMYFPLDKIQDPDLLSLAAKTRQEMWEKVSTRSDVRWGFRALNFFSLTSGGFAKISVPKREELFRKFEVSPINNARKAARFLRLYYLYSIYSSELGQRISGVTNATPIEHPDIDQFLRQNDLNLPTSPIRYSNGVVQHKDGIFDFIVVGSGPAGSVIAHEMASKGFRVIVLEQGSFVLPGAVDSRRIMDLHESFGMRISDDSGMIFRNGNAVGGGATINVDLAFSPLRPLIRHQVENWRKNNRIRSDQFLEPEVKRAYDWIREKVGTRTLSENEINANNRILWDGALRSGRKPSLYDLNTYPDNGSPSPAINKKGATEAFLVPAMRDRKNPLAIVPGAKVSRIVWKRPTASGEQIATGVEFVKVPVWKGKGSIPDPHNLRIQDGQTVRVEARYVIVSAGALGSPAVLLRSGLTNPQIGAGVVAHPSIPLIGIFNHEIKAWEGTPASVFVDDHAISSGTVLESMSADASYAAMMLPGDRYQIFELVRRAPQLGGFGVMLVDRPHETNRVQLDYDGNPEIKYLINKDDGERLAKAVADALPMFFHAGAKSVYIPSNEVRVEFTSPVQADEIKRKLKFKPFRTTITSAHLQSTCKMGTHPKNSVVDTQHRVWGTQNVFVVDGSVFPTSVGANPMQSIYTTAKLFSDRFGK